MPLERYDWILAIITIAFCASAFGNGANDVANSYATSVAARTLTMPQVGFLSMCTEFVGAVALGDRVTGTIKNDIIDIERFTDRPGVLMLAMMCAEIGSATWLVFATGQGFPVSTTQTIVGALVGVGFAAQADIKWAWDQEGSSLSQIAASWAIAPLVAAGFSAIIFLTLKYSVLERKDSFKWGMRLIPIYLAFTAGILALFLTIEAPTSPSLEEFGVGKIVGIILGCFFGVLVIAYVFFLPYFYRRLVKEDARVKFYHIPLGPLLWKDNPPLYFPANPKGPVVIDYYENAYYTSSDSSPDGSLKDASIHEKSKMDLKDPERGSDEMVMRSAKRPITPRERFLKPNQHLSYANPVRLFGFVKYVLLRGVTIDCVSHASAHLHDIHGKAKHYDVRVEHLWTYAQVTSAMLMSIAHGSNDVANAVGPWAATYQTYQASEVVTDADTPTWILAVAGILLGLGFWFFGYHIIKSLGNRITQLSPTRGYAMELGAAITVLLASRLSLPVSTTQCLTGATVGVALMNYSLGAVNWKQILFIFSGWVLTLPCAGLISGILMLLALNTPHF